MITPERFSAWRIFPRLLITLYGVAFWRTTEWFMQLPEPTNAQSAFVSVIVGAGAAWFGLYVGGPRNTKVENKERIIVGVNDYLEDEEGQSEEITKINEEAIEEQIKKLSTLRKERGEVSKYIEKIE